MGPLCQDLSEAKIVSQKFLPKDTKSWHLLVTSWQLTLSGDLGLLLLSPSWEIKKWREIRSGILSIQSTAWHAVGTQWTLDERLHSWRDGWMKKYQWEISGWAGGWGQTCSLLEEVGMGSMSVSPWHQPTVYKGCSGEDEAVSGGT